MRLRPLLAVVTATLAAGCAAAPSAEAAIAYAPCSPAGFQCGRLSVPIDRTGVVGGEISLNTQRAVVSAKPGNVAVRALAGGPGQAAIPAATDFARVLGPALATRDLL